MLDTQQAPQEKIVSSSQPRLVDRGLIKVTPATSRRQWLLIASGVVGFLVVAVLGYTVFQFFRGTPLTIFRQDQVEIVSLPEESQLSKTEYLALPAAVQEAHAQNPNCPLEVKMCPDRTLIGRTGPNCAFADCPPPDYSKLDEVDTDDPFRSF